MFRHSVTPSELRQILSYDASSGELTWKARDQSRFPDERSFNTWNARFAGKRAGGYSGAGYISLSINGVKYQAHRIAYAVHYGHWPNGQIDHVNGDRSDNRIQNLRSVTHAQNCRNKRKLNANSSGYCGVHFERQTKRWRAQIQFENREIRLGRFDTVEEAVAARKRAEAKFDFTERHGK